MKVILCVSDKEIENINESKDHDKRFFMMDSKCQSSILPIYAKSC